MTILRSRKRHGTLPNGEDLRRRQRKAARQEKMAGCFVSGAGWRRQDEVQYVRHFFLHHSAPRTTFAERRTAMAIEPLIALGFFVFVLLLVTIYDKHQRAKRHHGKNKQDRENHAR